MKKLTSKKGFTLMEMIIVVAIIAILAVVTLPTLTGSTSSAEKAADAANLRSAKAAYQVQKLEGKALTEAGYYDVEDGIFKKGTPATNSASYCGQCKGTNGHNGAYIQLTSGGVIKWSSGNESACPGEAAAGNQ